MQIIDIEQTSYLIYNPNKYHSLIFLSNVKITFRIVVFIQKLCKSIKERYLLSGELEKTNEPYAYKDIGIKM